MTEQHAFLHYNKSDSEILKHLCNEGIINLSDVEESMRKKDIEEVLSIHPYNIYQDSRKRWCTYVKDENSKNNRRLIAKTSLDDLHSALFAHYSGASEQVRYEKITLEELYPEWLNYKSKHVKSSTITKTQCDWNKFYKGTALANTQIRNMTVLMLDEWIHDTIQKYNMKKTCYHNVRSIITQELDYAVELGIINANPMKSVKVDVKRRLRKDRKKPSQQKVFLENEQKLFEERAWLEFRKSTRKSVLAPLAVVFLFYTGLRISEVCTVRYEDIDGDYIYIQRMLERDSGNVVDHTKGNANDRMVPLVPQAIEVIEACQQRQRELGVSADGYIFSITDDYVPFYAVSDLFRKYCKILNLPPRSVHATRRTYISTLIDAGVNINTIREIVGHSSEITTYGNYCFDRKDESQKHDQIVNAFNQ